MVKKSSTEVLQQLGAFDTGYKFVLNNFEGPLDLLYHLIKESKMEISDIKLADITEQYLAYLGSLEELDMDKASDFIDMAATLIEIKSKYLLPKPEESTEEFDSEVELIRQLKELELFKKASEQMKPYENVDRFYKEPDEKVNDYRYILKDMQLDGLLNALSNMLVRIKVEERQEVVRKIERDRFTVAEKIADIRQALEENQTVRFSQLFDGGYSRSEVINVFLALLELLKMQIITAKQTDFGDDIEIIKCNVEAATEDEV